MHEDMGGRGGGGKGGGVKRGGREEEVMGEVVVAFLTQEIITF